MRIHIIDLIFIILYMATLLYMGYRLGKENKNQEDYFLAGRSMPWLPIGLSVAATMISANGFIGGPGWAYQGGIGPYMVHIGVPLAIFFVLVSSVPMVYNLKVTSVYEYVELRLGVYSRMLAVLGFIANSIIQVSSMVFVPSLIISTLTGFDIRAVVPVVVIVAVVYTLMGGIKAVIWTDALQMIFMWMGLILAYVIITRNLDLGFFDTIATAQSAGKLNALDFTLDLSQTNVFWASLIGGTVMWIRYFGFDQGQVQRVLTAKSMKSVKRSYVTSALVMNILYFFLIFLGIMLYGYYGGQTFASANDVMIDFIINSLPVGVTGLVIAGVFAAAMSSVDSLLNSMSTVYVKDIHERFFSKTSGEASLKMSMSISAIWGAIIIAVTMFGFIGTTKSVLDSVGSYISYISGPMAGAFILSMFTARANDKGVALGVVTGFILNYVVTNQYAAITGASLSWIWKPFIGFAFTFLIGYVLSFLLGGGKIDKAREEYTVMGMRRKLLAEGKTEEDGVSILPFTFDKYAMIVLGFFFLQYVVLYLIR